MYRKKSLLYFVLFILIIQLISCDPVKKEVFNNTPDNGTISTNCDANGQLAMLASPVLIDNNMSMECGKTILTMKTSILLQDDYHSLSRVCSNSLYVELYYSRNENLINNLETLTANQGGANFQLPDGVGRLTEERNLNSNQSIDSRQYYIQPRNNYSPNRLEFKVQMPGFIADFYSPGININLNSFQNGDIIYYRWAKNINTNDGGDAIRFSEVLQLRYLLRNTVSAGSEMNITLPQERSVVLNGNVSSPDNSIQLVEWKWIRQNYGPENPPTIVSTNTPITEVIFNDFGIHNFELSATDTCGNSYRDFVQINVSGQLDNQNTFRNCIIKSGTTCANGLGRNMFVKNVSSTNSFRVRILETTDLRSWQDSNTAGAGTVVSREFEIELLSNQEFSLGCNVENGSGLNASDRLYKTWRIINEQRL